MSLVKFITHGMPKSSLFLLFMPIFHRIFFTGNAAIRRRMVFLLKIPISFSSICHRVCLKNHSRNLHAPLCGIFHPNSVAVARYGALIRAKYPTNCDAHLAESLFQTRSSSVATWVYVQKYVKHKTLDEMLQEWKGASQFIIVMDTWFERLMAE